VTLSTSLQIPVIDFAPFVSGTMTDQQQVADQIHAACHDVGFLYLVNHGVDLALVERVFAQSEAFFSLPFEIKQRYGWTDATSNRGYIGVNTEQQELGRPADWKEAFSIRQETAMTQQNPWLEDRPEFRDTMLQFYEACRQAAAQILQAFAIALQLPPQFFSQKHGQNYTLRLLHYPPLTDALKPNQLRGGAHSDYGTITLLFQDAMGGLEIQDASGQWIPAPSIPDAVLVNIGDLMQRWTNHEFRSTLHRVINPVDGRSHRSRYSIAFFCHPNPDTEVTCIPGCQSAERPALYAPILAGDYILERIQWAHQPQGESVTSSV